MKLAAVGFLIGVVPWALAGFVWWLLAPRPSDARPADDDPMRFREGGLL